MLSAEGMFLKLGYICVQDTAGLKKYYNKDKLEKIIFYKNKREYSAKRESASSVLVVNLDLHEAIYQQMVEFGWFLLDIIEKNINGRKI
jgi:hypothetical protein